MAITETAQRLMGHLLRGVHAGNDKLMQNQPPMQAAAVLTVTSTAFAPGMPIPDHFTQYGDNVSPPLHIDGVPKGVQSLVLVCEDADAPYRQPFVHWIMYNIAPDLSDIPEGVSTVAFPSEVPGAGQGMNSAKTVGYAGPKPPPGHGRHHYHFQVFGLDRKLSFASPPEKDDLAKQMAGRVIAEGELIGTYEKA